MNPDIIIPTCKTREEIAPLMCELQGYSRGCRTIPTCLDDSAAANRNYGLEEAGNGAVIMLDDDIAGFYDGWWQDLIEPLTQPDVVYVSARLLKVGGKELAPMMFMGNPSDAHITDVPRAPTACVSFMNTEIRFNEEFKGSGFEDDDFCAQLQMANRNKRFVINNKCRLVHINEEKGQGAHYEHNKQLFDSLWETSGLQGEFRTRKAAK